VGRGGEIFQKKVSLIIRDGRRGDRTEDTVWAVPSQWSRQSGNAKSSIEAAYIPLFQGKGLSAKGRQTTLAASIREMTRTTVDCRSRSQERRIDEPLSR